MASAHPFPIPVRWTGIRRPYQIKHAETAWDAREENAANERAYKKALGEWINSNVNLHGLKVKKLMLDGNLGIINISLRRKCGCAFKLRGGKVCADYPIIRGVKCSDCCGKKWMRTRVAARRACDALLAEGFFDTCDIDVHGGAIENEYWTDA
jgi:hypothetical protein